MQDSIERSINVGINTKYGVNEESHEAMRQEREIAERRRTYCREDDNAVRELIDINFDYLNISTFYEC